MGRFKYTHGGGVLTEDQRQFYEDNGYVLIKNNVSHALIDEVHARFIDICNGKVDPGMMLVVKETSLRHKGVKGEYLINKVQDYIYDEVLFKYTTNKAVVDVISSIIGPNVTAVTTMLLNKPPDADPKSSLHPLHQDMHYFPFRPADRIAGAWTAMERADQSNGCLYVIPGSHKGDLYPHVYPEGVQNKLYHCVQGMDHLPKVHLVMEKGDTVFLHPILLHGSGPNYTKGFRKAISSHYADNNCHFINVAGTMQEHVALEAEEMWVKRGLPLCYADIWRSKSRIVSGIPGNFQQVFSHL